MQRHCEENWRRTYWRVLWVTLLLTGPLYIAAYRISAANLVPLDDYQGLLLNLRQGNLAALRAPFGYRILTLALAIPVMRIPPPMFTRLSLEVSADWLRATFALCTVSYGFLVLATLALYGFLKQSGIGLCGAVTCLIIFWSSPVTLIYLYPMTDAAAFFWIVMLLWMYARRSPVWFAVSSLLGVLSKETTILLIGFTLIVHAALWAERRRQALIYLALTIPAVLIYMGAKLGFPLPGNEAQWALSTYLSKLAQAPQYLGNIRGLLLNIYPLWPFAACGAILWRSAAKRRIHHTVFFHWSHLLVALGMGLFGMMLGVKYNLGRIVFFAFPLCVPLIGWWVNDRLHAQG